MAKTPKNQGKPWTSGQVQQLRNLAKGNTPTRVIGIKLERSEAAVRSKAHDENISLKPTNQSPYGVGQHSWSPVAWPAERRPLRAREEYLQLLEARAT